MQKLLFNPFALFLLGLATLVFVLSLRSTQQKNQEKAFIVESNQEIVQKLEEEKKELLQEIAESESTFSMELTVRNELLKQKPDEIVLQLPPVSPQPSPTPTPTISIEPWKEWLELIR